MKVLMVASEMVPYAKTGGLADVVGSLPLALKNDDMEIKCILPYYSMVEQSGVDVTAELIGIPVDMGNEKFTGNILRKKGADAVEVYFVQQHQFFTREGLYGTPEGDYPDNLKRFIFFSRIVLRFCELINFAPDIVHCHDWQAGLIPVYIKTLAKNKSVFQKTAIIFTIHNIAYQGLFGAYQFPLTDLPASVFTVDGLEYWGKMNWLKAGINFSDYINTVSLKYSQEIQTPEFGYGMDGILRNRRHRLTGIINGVDYTVWNPETDELIAANYSIQDLKGKKKCKADLLASFNLPKSAKDRPVLGIISRLAAQKGFDLLAEIIEHLMERNLTVVLLGTGEQKYHDLFWDIANRFPEKIGVKIAFDNQLAHKIEAGSDMFLMPSRYEPCGLNQIYSLKYGTIPVVHATGGLDDTVQAYDPISGKGNGFKFHNYTAGAFLSVIDQALEVYSRPEEWKKLMINAMQADFSWEKSANSYKALYELSLGLVNRK
ncbi:glycogen synthase GlgA [candidate division KSB1 bacterium]|nr:glycogen synthase GlgA [candidate division KSB1 bacterium]